VETVAFSNANADVFIAKMVAEEKAAAAGASPAAENNSNNSAPTLTTVPVTKNSVATNKTVATSKGSKIDKLDGKDKKDDKIGGGRYFASGSRDRTVRIWETATGVCVKTLTGHDNWVRCVLFHPSGKYLVSCSDDRSIRLWDISRSWRMIHRIDNAHRNFIQHMDWNRTIPLLASAAVDGVLHVWTCR